MTDRSTNPMSLSRWILPTLAGIAVGATLVIACSDDSPSDADAAACDCPAAEPPITGRVMSVTSPTAIGANTSGSQVAQCPAGAILLGGGCRLDLGVDDPQILISVAAPSTAIPNAFACQWVSTSSQTRTAVAEARCLVPAQ